MLKSIDSYQEEVLLTVAAVLGGYSLAHQLGVSAPLAMVAAGILIGNHGRRKTIPRDNYVYGRRVLGAGTRSQRGKADTRGRALHRPTGQSMRRTPCLNT